MLVSSPTTAGNEHWRFCINRGKGLATYGLPTTHPELDLKHHSPRQARSKSDAARSHDTAAFTGISSEVGLQIEAMIAFALPYVPGRDTAIHQRTERQLSEEPADRILTPSMS